MHTIAETKPQYKVIDKNNNNVIKVFDDLDDIYPVMDEYCYSKYGESFKTLIQGHLKNHLIEIKKIIGYKQDFENVNAFGNIPNIPIYKNKLLYGLVVVSDSGEIIDTKSIPMRWHKKYNSNKYEVKDKIQNKILSGLIYCKNNINKSKKSYRAARRHRLYRNHVELDLCLNSRNYRRITTFNTIKKTLAVVKEDQEPEFRGRIRTLPSSWDQIRVGTHDLYKSWKHNSKRRKQWKSKSDVNI